MTKFVKLNNEEKCIALDSLEDFIKNSSRIYEDDGLWETLLDSSKTNQTVDKYKKIILDEIKQSKIMINQLENDDVIDAELPRTKNFFRFCILLLEKNMRKFNDKNYIREQEKKIQQRTQIYKKIFKEDFDSSD